MGGQLYCNLRPLSLSFLFQKVQEESWKVQGLARSITGRHWMLLLLLWLPLGRSLVTRHSVRPDLAPVLRLKGGATFNQWLRLFRVVVKGAKGGARNAQARVPAARGTASRGVAVEQGAAFSRVLSAPRSTELAMPSGSLTSGSLAGGSTLAGVTSMAAATAVIARPPPAAGTATTSLGSAASVSTRSLNQPAPDTAVPAPAATPPGVEPARGVDAQLPLHLSTPAQRVEPPTGDPNANPNSDADPDPDPDPDPYPDLDPDLDPDP